jgi:hypothetical protein
MTRIFVSYKREYADFARRVRDRLREWGYETWFDLDDIQPGAYFRLEIQKGLESSQVICGVMTQEAFASREVMAEWDYFLAKNKRLVPLKYAQCEPMYHIQHIQYIDFTNDEITGFEALRKALPPIEVATSVSPVTAEPVTPPPSMPTAETTAPPSTSSGETTAPPPTPAVETEVAAPPLAQAPPPLPPAAEAPKPETVPIAPPVMAQPSQSQPARRRATTEQVNRSRMLQKVNDFWIRGVLEK